jgi:sarcosine dehydrogenase
LTSGGYGYTVARSIGYGYVRNPAGVTADYVGGGRYELEVGGERVAAEVSFRPFYDPTNSRVQA